MVPSLGSDVDFCALLASKGTTVFDADYRKAPEFPFPAASHDVEDLVAYLHRHAADFDVQHLTLSGFSAGGGLAMTAAVTQPQGTAAGVACFYSNPDMTRNYPAPDDKSFDSGMVLPGWLRAFFYRCYVLPGQDRGDPRLSARFAKIERWPEHVFLACGMADSLHDAGKMLVEELKGNGHQDATFLSVEREAHGFDKRVKEGSATEHRRHVMYEQAVEMIGRAHGTA